MGTMEIDNPSISNQPHSASPSILKKTVTWSTDLGIADISAGFISQLKSSQATSNISGDIESEHIDYKSPQDPVISTVKLHQRIRFNHRGVTSDVPAIELFKSFASSLKRADPSLIILPFHASKQHYSSLPTLKHILRRKINYLNSFNCIILVNTILLVDIFIYPQSLPSMTLYQCQWIFCMDRISIR
jgi:hypothetical protein